MKFDWLNDWSRGSRFIESLRAERQFVATPAELAKNENWRAANHEKWRNDVCSWLLQTVTLNSHQRRNQPMRPMGRVPSDFGVRGDQVYLFRSNVCNWVSFWGSVNSLTIFPKRCIAVFNGKGKRGSAKGIVWSRGGVKVGDGKGMDEEKEGDLYPPHLRSSPTFQPWLRLRFTLFA